jgi:hypothetical protein
VSEKVKKGKGKATERREWPYSKLEARNQMAERMRSARRKLVRVRRDDRMPAELVLLLSEINEDLLIGEQWALQAGAPIMPEEL